MLLATARGVVKPIAVTLKPRKRGVAVKVGTLARFGVTVAVRVRVVTLVEHDTVDNPTVGRCDTQIGCVRAELRVDLDCADRLGGDRLMKFWRELNWTTPANLFINNPVDVCS